MVWLWRGAPLLVDAPSFVELAIIEADPDVRGDTSSGGSRPACWKLGRWCVCRCSWCVARRVRVDTRSGDYVARVRAA